MPVVCKYIPNRSGPRYYRASDVGRIACYAMQAGATQEEIVEELRKRCMPDLCKPTVLDELADMIEDIIFDLLTGRLGRIIKVIRDWIQKWPGGRRMLNYMSEVVESLLGQAHKVIDVIRSIEQT